MGVCVVEQRGVWCTISFIHSKLIPQDEVLPPGYTVLSQTIGGTCEPASGSIVGHQYEKS